MTYYVDTYESLTSVAAHLRSCDRIALDTEAASFHRYSQRACLVQVSTPTVDALIDPIALADLGPLSGPLNRSELEVVMHDADSDLRILDRDFSLRVARVFDTRVAAQLLGEPAIGLAALLEKHLGIALDKRFQRADWSIRPLPPEMVAYAITDTKHLVALRDRLELDLKAKDRFEWAQEEFALLPGIRWSPREPDPDAYLRISGVRDLGPVHKGVARALNDCRDAIAKEADRAPFRVFGNEHLVAMAMAAPRTLSELSAVPRIPSSIVQRYGSRIVDAVAEALAQPPIEGARKPPRARERFDPATEERMARLKVVRTSRADELGLDPGVLCPNGTLAAIARAWSAPRKDLGEVAELKRWQRLALGQESLVKALNG